MRPPRSPSEKGRKWRDRAGRRMGSDYTAVERSTSQSLGMSPFLSPTGRSRERHFPDVPGAHPKRSFAFRPESTLRCPSLGQSARLRAALIFAAVAYFAYQADDKSCSRPYDT